MTFGYLRSAYDHVLGRPKAAFPTRFHYVEILRDHLARCSIAVSYLGQHCLVLTNTTNRRELVIAVRYTTERDLRLLEDRKKKHGSRIVYLIDDDYWAMIQDKKLRSDYRARLRLFVQSYFDRLLPLLDAVVAPSQQILGRLPCLPGIQMQPAHLNSSNDASHFENPKQIRIVFLGTSTHSADFLKVAPGIAKALENDPRIHLTTFLGKRGTELLPAGPQVTHRGDMFFPRFQSWLAAQRFHIGLAPYEPNTVNNGRSNLKFHQHAFVGAAGLYTATTAFADCVEHGRNGLILEHEPDAWKEGILGLSKAPQQMRSLAEAGYQKSIVIGNHDMRGRVWASLI